MGFEPSASEEVCVCGWDDDFRDTCSSQEFWWNSQTLHLSRWHLGQTHLRQSESSTQSAARTLGLITGILCVIVCAVHSERHTKLIHTMLAMEWVLEYAL